MGAGSACTFDGQPTRRVLRDSVRGKLQPPWKPQATDKPIEAQLGPLSCAGRLKIPRRKWRIAVWAGVTAGSQLAQSECSKKQPIPKTTNRLRN